MMFFNQVELITQESQELINACIDGDITLVKSWIAKGADINAMDPQYGDTALSQAALNGHEDIIVFLLSVQESTQYSKDLALIFSSQAGHVEIMKVLVENRADVNANYFDDYPSPIYQTIMQNKHSAFEYLIGCKGIDLHLVAFKDSLPVLMAAFLGRLRMVKALINKGVGLNTVNCQGLSIRGCALKQDHQEIVQYIDGLVAEHEKKSKRVITREAASLKLPNVVREEAMRYMSSLANPSTAEELRAFTRLISLVKEDGVEVIWDQIKGSVANRMFDEFGSLDRNRADHSYTRLVDVGQDTELPDLSIFQEQYQNSEGYHQFCSQMLRQSGLFFAHKRSAEYLSEHRHDSREAQREYDQRFGLVLRNS